MGKGSCAPGSGVLQAARAAVSEYHSLAVAKLQRFISHSSGGWKAQIEALADLVPSGFSPDVHLLLLTRESSLVSLLRRPVIPPEGPTLVTSSKPRHLPEAPAPNYMDRGRGADIRSLTDVHTLAHLIHRSQHERHDPKRAWRGGAASRAGPCFHR